MAIEGLQRYFFSGIFPLLSLILAGCSVRRARGKERPLAFFYPSERDHMKEEEMIGSGKKFERIRRITGYLVGTTDRFNDAKRAEEHDRVKHVTGRDVGQLECGCH